MKKFFIHENDLNTTIDVLWKSSMQKVSDNKYVFPGKDFDSSNVGGHINCLITRFWTHLHESPMVSDVRNFIILYDTFETPDLLFWENCENFI